MNEAAISLGWRCETAQIGVNSGIRGVRSNGYKTCPFDLLNTNYIGVCKCIEDDFKYLTDPNYLELIEGSYCSEHFEIYKGDIKIEKQIVNTYYGFVMNHESPGHGNLYINENWSGGINHFVDNNFEKFIERYNQRVSNFRNYINNSNKINFLLMRYNSIPIELCEIISNRYPSLNFEIYNYYNYSNYTYNITISKDDISVHNWEKKQWGIMGIDKDVYPEEYNRYDRKLLTEDDINSLSYDSRIKMKRIIN